MAHIEILKDGQPVSEKIEIDYLPTGDLFIHYRINLVTLNDTGLYECRATNTLGSTSRSMHVNIDRQKPLIQQLVNITIVSGKQFTLPCYASGQPNLQLKWIDETSQEIMNVSSSSPLFLTAITTRSNRYTCQAINDYGHVSSQVHVTIHVPAKIIASTSNQTITINSSLTIFCLAEGDNQLDIQLINPHSKMLNMLTSQMNMKKNLSWTIERVQITDSGIYDCHAKNNYSEDRSHMHIIVQNVPNRIDNIFIDDVYRVVWTKPFDGHANIFKYILRIRYQQGRIEISID
jgi:hypothetical protein